MALKPSYITIYAIFVEHQNSLKSAYSTFQRQSRFKIFKIVTYGNIRSLYTPSMVSCVNLGLNFKKKNH